MLGIKADKKNIGLKVKVGGKIKHLGDKEIILGKHKFPPVTKADLKYLKEKHHPYVVDVKSTTKE